MSNLTKTKEAVEVLAIFTHQGPRPYALKWGERKYVIEKINLTYEAKVGNSKLIYFSVTSQDNYFKLVFDTNDLKWYLEEAYHE